MAPPIPQLSLQPIVQFVAETLLPTKHGEFRVRAYRDLTDGSEPLAIVFGQVEHGSNVLLRVHDQCLTSEVFGSLKCDCADQLDFALKTIREDGGGVVIYLPQEGRGIGLANKIAAYRLQEDGLDTVEANRHLGLPDDLRRYDAAAAMIADMDLKSICLMTNNPRKIKHLRSHGVNVASRRVVKTEVNQHSVGYIDTKIARMGHALDGSSIDSMLAAAPENDAD